MSKSTSHKGLPVLDNDGRLKGMVTLQDIYNSLNEERGDIPVVERNDREHLIGLITRKCVIEAYNNELHKKEKE